MRHLRNLLLVAFAFLCVICLKNTAHAAANITYKRIDGTPVVNGLGANVTDSTAVAAYTNLNTELGVGGTLAGKTAIAYLYDGCRSATDPTVFSQACFAENYAVTVVLAEDVDTAAGKTAHGTVGTTGAIWFVYNNALYITGTPAAVGGVVNVKDTTYNTTSSYKDQTETKVLTGAKFETYYPDFFYSDLDGTGSGVQDPATFDEMTYATDDWYTFKDVQNDTYQSSIKNRDAITLDFRLEAHGFGTFAPKALGWVTGGFAPSISTIYVSDDLELEGNLIGLFNANFDYMLDQAETDGDLRDSIYTSLTTIYMYADLQKVDSAAGMFARIPNLQEVLVRPTTYAANRPTATPHKMTNVKTLSYLFYGDKNLVNTGDSFINALDLSGSNGLIATNYMFAGAEKINKPSVKTYHMDAVKFAEGMFFGAKNAELVCDNSGTSNDIYSWKLTNLVNSIAMFSGGDAGGGITNLNDPLKTMDPGLSAITEYGKVITGTVDMRNWDATALKMASMMFSRNGSDFKGVIFDDSYPQLLDASSMFLCDDYVTSVVMKNTQMPLLKNSTAMFRLTGSKAAAAGAADLSGWRAPSLENAAFMFYASGFKSIDTTNISDMSKVVDAIGMFGECNKLENLGNGALETVKFNLLESGEMMFINDEALVKIDTLTWGMPKVTSLAFAFQNTPSLTTAVDFENWSLASCTNLECFCEGNGMAAYNISGADTKNVTSWAFAFANNPNVTTVSLPTAGTMLYSATSLCGVFSNDPKLTSVNFPSSLTGRNALTDVGGMFANDRLLTTAGISGIVGDKVTCLDYFMKNCESITAVNTANWNTGSVLYMQGAWDGCKKLSSFTFGSAFTGAKVVDAGTVFRNCYVLPTATISRFNEALGTSSTLADLYEAYKNCYAIITLDMSPLKLGTTTELRRVAAMDENAAYTTNNLTTIILPSTILTAPGVVLKDTDGKSINMFWVDGDGVADGGTEETTDTDDLLTELYIDGTPGKNILAYNFGGTNGDNDNRSFVKYTGRTINGKDVGTYSIASDTDKAAMQLVAESKFYTDGTTATAATNVPLNYSWTKDGTAISGAAEKTYETAKSGTYVSKAVPSLMTGSNTSTSASFIIGKSIASIEAKYTGKDVPVGSNYSLDDVAVSLVDTDGNKIPITKNDFTVDSQTVTKKGDNQYTVTYKNGDKTFTAKITVPGVRYIGSIKAEYTGPSVLVGKEYDGSYVKVTAYYADDTAKKEGFEVTPTSLSSLKVAQAGDNTFTATYEDKTQNKTFTADYQVNGYKTISSISATYTGDKIKVGEKYNKDDVKVTLYYADGSGSVKTTNFTVDSQTITREGGNSFTASYRDPFGNVYTAGFSVPGYKSSDSSSSSSSTNKATGFTPNNATGSTSSTVSAPTQQYSAGTGSTAVKKGTSTGVVQTGTTGKAVLYIIAIVALIGLIVFMVIQRRKTK